MNAFKGQWILVTGASRGFGKTLALEFAREGGNLILVARNDDDLEDVRQQVSGLGVECVKIVGDLTDEAILNDTINTCIEKELNILVNNAGIVWIELLEDVSTADIDRLITLNLTVPIKLTRAMIPMFKERKSGTIINVNSAGGKKPVPHHTVYCASKFGLNGFAETLKLEVQGYGIRIVNVSPGKMATQIFNAAGHPLDMTEFIPPEEMAKTTVAFLQLSPICSPAEIAIDRMK